MMAVPPGERLLPANRVNRKRGAIFPRLALGFGPLRRPAPGRASMAVWPIRARDSPRPLVTSSTSPSWLPLTTRCTPIQPRSGSACRSALPGTAGPRLPRRSTRTTSSRPPRRSATTGRATASTGRCTSGPTPTRSVSRAILAHNSANGGPRADGIVVTPSHNPPTDGGFKYNPPDGGPAGTEVTKEIQDRANDLLGAGLNGVRRTTYARALAADTTGTFDFLDQYVTALDRVIDVATVRDAGIRIGADPLGGASVAYWGEIGERYGLNLVVVNPEVDPTFRFMTLDWDGKIRMDCSSPSAMASLIRRQHEFTIATGNDTDSDRHGIVTPDAGLMNPNHYLAVAIEYLYQHRAGWPAGAAIGKTLVSSSMIDRVAG